MSARQRSGARTARSMIMLVCMIGWAGVPGLSDLSGLAASATPAFAQSALQRTPNLSGGWIGPAGAAHFNFIHRFAASDAPERKVSSAPTFLLAYAPGERILLGTHYATNSTVVPRFPNEWEVFGRVSLLAADRGAPLGIALQGGYNAAAESADGAAQATRSIGPFGLLAAVRAFSDAYGTGETGVALAGGATLRLGPIALAGDAATLVEGPEDEDAAWSLGLQLPLPYTPHTFSLHATSTNTATLQGASRGTDIVRYGFEFTVPITLRRYFGGRDSGAAPDRPAPVGPEAATDDLEPVAQVEDTPGGASPDTVVIDVQNLEFRSERVEVTPGTVVRWVNLDPVQHTITFEELEVDSGLIEPGESWERTFEAEGEHAYTCTPHPFMEAVLVVRPAGDADPGSGGQPDEGMDGPGEDGTEWGR